MTERTTARERAGKRAGIACIVLNTLLAGAKIAAGALTGAVSVLADGMNNLTDCGSNVVSVVGFKMSGKPADKEHPFGHRRAESVAALLIAAIILAVAAELAVQSVQKIVSHEAGDYSLLALIVLGVSVPVKLGMFLFNRALAKRIDSDALRATAADSLSDAAATAVVLAALLVSRFTHLDLDGWAGAAVSVFIAFTGLSVLREAVSRLLGRAPDERTVNEIRTRVCAFDGVHGVHDLTVHSYGQGELYATVHVEVDARMALTDAHDLADRIEKDLAEHSGIALTVHIDPLVLGDPRVDTLREMTERAAADIDPNYRVHDFRVVGGQTHANLVFEVAIPYDSKLSPAEVRNRLAERIAQFGENLGAVVTVERQNIV